jgi:proteasome activator subunit 4
MLVAGPPILRLHTHILSSKINTNNGPPPKCLLVCCKVWLPLLFQAYPVTQTVFIGSKHFPGLAYKKLWDWVTPRLPAIFAQINPDTQKLWESLLHVSTLLPSIRHSILKATQVVLVGRDPRRIQPLVDFIVNMNVDYNSSSAFVGKLMHFYTRQAIALTMTPVSKCLSVIGTLQNALDVRFEYKSDEFLKTYFDNVQTEYAEVRAHFIS